MRNIRAGALRTPISLGIPAIAKDAAGGEVITWTETDAWGLIEPLTGREWAGAVAVKDSVDCRISFRVDPTLPLPNARWRVKDRTNGRLYNIVTAMLVDKNGAVECLAKIAQGSSDGR